MNKNIVTKVSKNRQPIKNRLQKYAMGSSSLAVLSGVLGQTAVCSAGVISLNTGTLIDGSTLNPDGSGSLGASAQLFLTFSSVATDYVSFFSGGGNLSFRGDVNFPTTIASDGGAYTGYYGVNDVVGMTPSNFKNYTNIVYGDTAYSVWSVDRSSGAIGFRDRDGKYGYIHVSWVTATQTLTFLGTGAFDDTPGNPITVTASVPEPSGYAAALGLGTLGLAYYRRRPGNKSRPKN